MPSFRPFTLATLLLFGLVGCATTSPPPAGAAAAKPADVPASPPPSGAGTPAAGATPTGNATGAARPAGAATPAAVMPAAAASAPNATPPAPPGSPPPYATVIKDAKQQSGLLTVWQKDEKLWLELKPEDFGRPLFLSPKIASGIGEPAAYGGLMNYGIGNGAGGPQWVEFRKLQNQVQLIARNPEYRAADGTPESRAVQAGYSPSLIGSAPVASQPNPANKAVLIDATSIFVSDLLGIGTKLQRAYRQGYQLDARNSAVTVVRVKDGQLVVEVLNHYATGSIAVPTPGAPPNAPAPSVPSTLPDVRSLFVQLHYSLTALPAQPMPVRVADARVGYFDTVVHDFGNDLARTPKVRHITRWRLEKRDPQAALSPPLQPITFWLDRNIPLKYRDTIRAGVLEWNKAFEKIGYQDAVAVQQQPDDADWDTLDTDHASVRWMTNIEPSFGAIGPKHVDPRTGEILDSDIAIESLSSRNVRAQRSQVLTNQGLPGLPNLVAVPPPSELPRADASGSFAPERLAQALAMREALQSCQHAELASEQLAYALDVLEARGEVDPASPEAEQFVQDYLKDVTIHEVGHALGLRHNFRASRLYRDGQLSDPAFTREHGLASSVMDYVPVNLMRPGEPTAQPFQTVLGPYDYWAIEYGYKPLDAKTPEDEARALDAIAAKSGSDPAYDYGTDEDYALGIDPEALQMDLGADPLAFATKRFEIARDLLRRQEVRPLRPSEDYAVLRRSVAYAVRDAGRAASALARQVGGVRTLRDHPGSGRDPLQPVPAGAQRAAMDLIARSVFAADSLSVSPRLQRRLAPDFLERGDALQSGEGNVSTDYPLTQTVLDVQRALLGQLMSDAVAVRLLDSEAKAERPGQVYTLGELHRRLAGAIWSELGQGGDIAPLRRELQREHLNRVSAILLRPSALSRADARALLRHEARQLLGRLEAALRASGGRSAVTRAHLEDSVDTLRLALDARAERAGL